MKTKTCTISLPMELYLELERKIDSGYYSSVSEIIREALRNLIKQELVILAQLNSRGIEEAVWMSDEVMQDQLKRLGKHYTNPNIPHDFERPASAERIKRLKDVDQ